MINIDNIRMNVIETSENGIVNQDTIFHFKQQGTLIYANYSGGLIEKGFLVGKRSNNQLMFTYCQIQIDGTLDNGKSKVEIEKFNGKIRLIEHFQWDSRPGVYGINIFQEL
jgi:hypothetical protein